MVFSTLAFCQVVQALAVRSTRGSLFHIGLLTNKSLLALVVAVILLQLTVLFVPFLQTFFHVTPLTLPDIAVSIGLDSLVLWATELEKLLLRRRYLS